MYGNLYTTHEIQNILDAEAGLLYATVLTSLNLRKFDFLTWQ